MAAPVAIPHTLPELREWGQFFSLDSALSSELCFLGAELHPTVLTYHVTSGKSLTAAVFAFVQ